ncbi:MAG TPA: hypothetical protein P5254_03450 [Aquihabitans sp.]|nr:hypothetical protein [Aquihabitans sp.]
MSEIESHEVEVDLAAFLPDGVEIETPTPSDRGDEPGSTAPGGGAEATGPGAPSLDLEALRQIELDLDAVDAAIAALDAGTYGIDPATGAALPDELLAADPTHLG